MRPRLDRNNIHDYTDVWGTVAQWLVRPPQDTTCGLGVGSSSREHKLTQAYVSVVVTDREGFFCISQDCDKF